MFGFFKKKEETPRNTGNEQFKEFAARFRPEELSILAVTGANGFDGGNPGEEALWIASIGLTAWMEEDGPDVHEGDFPLSAIVDEQLLGVLRRRAPGDFIIKFKGRVSEDGQRLLLVDLPEPGFDPDLKAILERQKKPVTFWEDGLGTFTLNRRVDWFETETDWLGTTVSLVFDRNEERADCVRNARKLLAGAENWDSRLREYAADELSDPAGEAGSVTRESFTEQMELESIEIRGDGRFEFWFSDGDMGRSIRVSGDLENGPGEAGMEGLGGV